MVSETVASSVAQGLWAGVLLFWGEGTAVCSTAILDAGSSIWNIRSTLGKQHAYGNVVNWPRN
jgi:hypothetical protein